jgi:hypothetical protein
MSAQSQRQLLAQDAHTVVFHADEAHATGQKSQLDLCGARVQGVVYQFPNYRCRAFHYLTSRNLADQFIWQIAYGAPGRLLE